MYTFDLTMSQSTAIPRIKYLPNWYCGYLLAMCNEVWFSPQITGIQWHGIQPNKWQMINRSIDLKHTNERTNNSIKFVNHFMDYSLFMVLFSGIISRRDYGIFQSNCCNQNVVIACKFHVIMVTFFCFLFVRMGILFARLEPLG